jgi:DNA-binding response OmpR family regulator
MKKQIMVVDDDETVLALVDIVLRRHGFSVIKENDPQAVLDSLRLDPPDLMILDFMMPDMDGLELCQALRSQPQTSHTPIIILSATDSPHVIAQLKAAGADAYLQKVTIATKLLPSVKALLKM